MALFILPGTREFAAVERSLRVWVGASGAALAAWRLSLWQVLRAAAPLGGASGTARACAELRRLGSLWQRRRLGPGLRAPARARRSLQPGTRHLIGHELGLSLWPAALPSAAVATAPRLLPRAGNMPLDSYCYLQVVGRGSYGEVTLVRHRRDGRQVS